jgi:hypothetical protein
MHLINHDKTIMSHLHIFPTASINHLTSISQTIGIINQTIGINDNMIQHTSGSPQIITSHHMENLLNKGHLGVIA